MIRLEITGIEYNHKFKAIQYWEDTIWEKHLAEPICGRWTPCYTCYLW